MRIDQKLAELHPEISRNQIQNLIKNGQVSVNNQIIDKKNQKINDGDEIKIHNLNTNKTTKHQPIALELDIIYEDQNVLAINKQAGLSVHPRNPEDQTTTLVNGLLHYLKSNLSQQNGDIRPGIVHRLDKDTSGVLIIAKNDQIHNFLAQQFADRTTIKKYLTLAIGQIKEAAKIEAPIGRSAVDRQKMSINHHGRFALTKITPLQYFSFDNTILTLTEVQIYTGRTHQIRVHLNAIGHPVLGDSIYGQAKLNKLAQKKLGLNRQFLHAQSLNLHIDPTSPETKKELLAKLPQDLNEVLTKLKPL
jgi:23S rRNA pseudouridine1911/1915/1917 synthase